MAKSKWSLPIVKRVLLVYGYPVGKSKKSLPVDRAFDPYSKNKGELPVEKIGLPVDIAENRQFLDVRTPNFFFKSNLPFRV